jgi:hypothetical protein
VLVDLGLEVGNAPGQVVRRSAAVVVRDTNSG